MDDTPKRIVAFVKRYPGVHVREIERQLGLPDRLVAYHVPALIGSGRVLLRSNAGYARLYPAAWRRRRDKTLDRVAALRHPVAHAVATRLAVAAARHGELARQIGVPKASVSYHLHALAALGLVNRERRGRRRLYAPTSALGPLLAALEPLPPRGFDVLDDLVG